MFPGFSPTTGQVIEGLLLLISIGFNGLLIHFIKEGHKHEDELLDTNAQSAKYHEKLEFQIEELESHITVLDEINASLVTNQKPIPWNKGKKGYKLNRKPKEAKPTETVFVLNTDQPIIASWDKNGNMTKTPEWTMDGHRSAGTL